MSWFNNLFSRKNSNQSFTQKAIDRKPADEAQNPTDRKAPEPSVEASLSKGSNVDEKYTYYVGDISSTDPWIFIICNEEDATWDYEPFAYLVKKAAGELNNGVWEGNIVSAGDFKGDTRYRIKNDPLLMVYQYDTLFGIVIEYTRGIGLNGTLNYLSNVLGITVDEKFR